MKRIRPALALVFVLAAVPTLAAPPDVSKVNGKIDVAEGQVYGHLETVNGSIEIGSNAQVAQAETVNGSIRVGTGAQTAALETVNGSIRLEQRVRTSGGISTVNGGVFVDRGGRVEGDVETVNGGIGLVDTDVSGDLSTVTGDVTVGVGSHVRGGLHIEKPSRQWIRFGKPDVPRVVIGPGAVVDGPLVFEREVALYVHSTARTGPITGAKAVTFDTPMPPER